MIPSPCKERLDSCVLETTCQRGNFGPCRFSLLRSPARNKRSDFYPTLYALVVPFTPAGCPGDWSCTVATKPEKEITLRVDFVRGKGISVELEVAMM